MKRYPDPEVGDNFNRWTFLSKIFQENEKEVFWFCQCQCGEKRVLEPWSVRSGNSKSCGCWNSEQIHRRSWKGYGKISGHYLTVLRKSAEIRNITYDVSKEYIWELYNQQNGKCNLSGMDIVFASHKDKIKQTASLDRIDNNKGYLEGNVQWLHKYVNNMKLYHTQEYFIKICEEIYKWNQKKS